MELQNIKFKPHNYFNPNDETIIVIDVKKLDNYWRKTDPLFYLPPFKGEGDKLERIAEFLNTNPKSIESPILGKDDSGNIGFYDGRHRFRILCDLGLKTMPIIVKKRDAKFFSILFT